MKSVRRGGLGGGEDPAATPTGGWRGGFILPLLAPATARSEREFANLRNKISRGGFTGAFLIQCLAAMGVTSLRLED